MKETPPAYNLERRRIEMLRQIKTVDMDISLQLPYFYLLEPLSKWVDIQLQRTCGPPMPGLPERLVAFPFLNEIRDLKDLLEGCTLVTSDAKAMYSNTIDKCFELHRWEHDEPHGRSSTDVKYF